MGKLRKFARRVAARFSDEPQPRPAWEFFRAMADGMGSIDSKQALTVPPVLRGRNMVCQIATLPLVQYGPDRARVRLPLFEQIDPDVANVVTMAQTIEDLLFHGRSLWHVTGFSNVSDGEYPISARHVGVSSWTLRPPDAQPWAPLPSGDNPRGAVPWVDGVEVGWDEVILFESPNPPLLEAAGRAIKTAILLERTAQMYADNPRPLDFFTPDGDAEPYDSPEEAQEQLLGPWKTARKTSSTAFFNKAVKYNQVQNATPGDIQLVELKKQCALEIANAIGVDPEDLGISTTSRTYQNAVDRRVDKVNEVLALYMRAITDRLSMGDVTKRGYTVGFDLDDYLKANPKDRAEIDKVYIDSKVDTVDEVRARRGKPPLTAAQKKELNPPPPPQLAQAPNADPNGRGVVQPPAADKMRLAASFSDDQPFVVFDSPEVAASFSVDLKRRTITGIAVPWGKIGKSGGRKWKFAKDSLRYNRSLVNQNKFLDEHDNSIKLGHLNRTWSDDQGQWVEYKVDRGPRGDRALALAASGEKTGLSVGIDFEDDSNYSFAFAPDPEDPGVRLVTVAPWKETSHVRHPAFDDARVSAVTMAADEGNDMQPEITEPTTAPVPAGAPGTEGAGEGASAQTFTADQVADLFARFGIGSQPTAQLAQPEVRPEVNPTRHVAVTTVTREALPYRFDRGGRFTMAENEFSTDVADMLKQGDEYGTGTDAGKRVMGLIRARFAADPTITTDVDELSPTIDRPDMYVGLRPYTTPMWKAVNKGAPPNGVEPFRFPKRSSSTIAVGAHTEGTEPEGKGLVTTSQTVTPGAFSGKASMTREVFDLGGNPAISNLIWQEFTQSWFKGLETATGTFLNTLTAATDLALTAGGQDYALTGELEGKLAALAFVDGYNFDVAFVEQYLYAALVAAEDESGRKIYPIINPQNANGQATSRFGRIDVAGLPFVPASGLGAGTSGSSNNSWLIDPSVVWGWASAPQRLEFAGTDSSGNYAPVAMIDIAVWGYQAFANTDIGGVRQITYDNTGS